MMGPTTIANPSKDDFNLNALVADRDRPCLFPIEYAYDYMKNAHRYLIGPPSTVDSPLREKIRPNSIPLNPFLAKVPWYSGLTTLRQNKYWKINISRTTELLNLFAEDVSFNSAQNTNGRALANFARKELKTRSFDRYSRFTSYMFPDADEHRTALLAQAIVLIVIFDDTWEEAALGYVKRVQKDFIRRIEGNIPPIISKTALQKRIADVHRGFLEEDAIAGNGGADVIAALIDFCKHSPPVDCFASVKEYLDYRYIDVAMPFSYACAKFSIGSDIDLQDTKLHVYLRLVGDHFSIANDIASYDKEYISFKSGKAKYLINVIAVVQKLLGVLDSNIAKSISYALQLQTEEAIIKELERMKITGNLTDKQWKFVDSVLIMAAGNVFTSVVISRYGGEAARIINPSQV